MNQGIGGTDGVEREARAPLPSLIAAASTPQTVLGNAAKALEISNLVGEALRQATRGMETMNQAFARTSAVLTAPSHFNLARTITAIGSGSVGLGNVAKAVEVSGQIGALRSVGRFDQTISKALQAGAAMNREVKPDHSLNASLERLNRPPQLDLPPIPPASERPEVKVLRQIREQSAPKPAGLARLGGAAAVVLVAAGGIVAEAHLLPVGQAVAGALMVASGGVSALGLLLKNSDVRAGLRQLRRRRRR